MLVLWIVTFSLPSLPTGLEANNRPEKQAENQDVRSNTWMKKCSYSKDRDVFVYSMRAVYSMSIHLCASVYVLHTHSHSGTSTQAGAHWSFRNITTGKLQKNMQ